MSYCKQHSETSGVKFMMTQIVIILLMSITCFKANGQVREPIVLVLKDLLKEMDKKDDTIRIFNFWATWCAPCIKEWPYFQNYAVQTSGTQTRLYMVSLDDVRRLKSKVIPFLEKNNYTAEVCLLNESNPNSFIDAIEPSWLGAIPATLMTYKGKRCFAEMEFHSYGELSDWINHCIKSKN